MESHVNKHVRIELQGSDGVVAGREGTVVGNRGACKVRSGSWKNSRVEALAPHCSTIAGTLLTWKHVSGFRKWGEITGKGQGVSGRLQGRRPEGFT